MIGKAFQIRNDFKREHALVSVLVYAAHQYTNELDRALEELETQELALQSAQEVYQVQHEKNMVKKALVAPKNAAMITLLATGPTALPSMT